MSAQGPLSDGADFGLIETLRWTRPEGFLRLDRHLARLSHSASMLGFPFDRATIRRALEAVAAREGEAHPLLRTRVELSRHGDIRVEAVPFNLPAEGMVYRVTIASRRFASDDPSLRHKTTRRARYEDALAEAARLHGADEVIFLNERKEICEGARTSVFIGSPEGLLTPPLACGLLPGVLRAELLATEQAREAVLRVEEIDESTRLFVGNSLRGLIPARLVG